MTRRRKLLIAFGTGALAAPLRAFGQQPAKAPDKVWRVGFLNPRGRPPSLDADFTGGFASFEMPFARRVYIEVFAFVVHFTSQSQMRAWNIVQTSYTGET